MDVPALYRVLVFELSNLVYGEGADVEHLPIKSPAAGGIRPQYALDNVFVVKPAPARERPVAVRQELHVIVLFEGDEPGQ